jgi:hypothetical protein
LRRDDIGILRFGKMKDVGKRLGESRARTGACNCPGSLPTSRVKEARSCVSVLSAWKRLTWARARRDSAWRTSVPGQLSRFGAHRVSLSLSSKHGFVIALKLERGLVAQDSEIGRCRIEKQLLLGAFQLGASGEHLLLGGFRFSLGAKAAKQRLRHLHAVARIVESWGSRRAPDPAHIDRSCPRSRSHRCWAASG